MTGLWIGISLFVAILVCLALVPAVGWLVVLIPIVALIWFAVLAGRAAAHGRTPMMRHTRETELLGPGGPDDPDR
jgi:hypothetical protein